MTTTVAGATGAGVAVEAADLTRCRRRVHLDHDPAAATAARAAPDPTLEQRRADTVAHRSAVRATVAAATGAWVVPPGPPSERLAATAAAVAEAAPVIVGGMVPGPDAQAAVVDVLVRLPEGGYRPVLVVRHRITDRGEGAITSPPGRPCPAAAGPDPQRKVRSQPRDLLGLAHLHRLLENAGWAPPPDAPHAARAGLVGLDADVVVWHDLTVPYWPGGRSTLAEHDARLADRIAVATAAATGAPALARPSRITECRRCPWWPTCEEQLLRAQDVSLVVRGEVAVALRAAGVSTVTALAALDPSGESPLPGFPLADPIALARAWLRDLPVVRRVPTVRVPRADVEVDVDMESFGESGAYLWGALLRHPGGRRPGDEPDGYRAFATWEPLPTADEARSFAEFWGWLTGVRARAAAAGRTFAAYCYNAHAENRWLLASARRFAGAPGVPTLAHVESFVADPAWVDLYALVDAWFLCAHGKGLKRVAPAAGFVWRDTEASGENSMRWYRAAVGLDDEPADPAQRQRLLEYNADDVAATAALRDWMTSPAIEEVPLAADL